MKISLNWLRKYVKIPTELSDAELIRLIGARLVEVEGVIDESHKYDNIYVVRVESCEKIPETHLSLCQINAGIAPFRRTSGAWQGEDKRAVPVATGDGDAVRERGDSALIQVVCGAPNVRAGMLAVWIAPGAVVPASMHEDAPFVIGERKMRGYESCGMLAGADELDFDDKHEKIAEIDPSMAQPGDKLADIFELNDLILEIENKSLTHRPDCFGIIGFAREVAGILGIPFDEPEFLTHEEVFPRGFLISAGNGVRSKDKNIEIKIADAGLCPRYSSAMMKVTEATEQEKYLSEMQVLLAKSGMMSVSRIVDVTNYLMLLTGQPLHAFDADKFLSVGGTDTAQIGVRLARGGEELMLLDGSNVVLTSDDIVITSNDIPVALAGAMGGASTMIDENTHDIILESASFSLYNLRKTQMAHGIFSEAITRFTKGTPAGGTFNVLAEAVREIGGKPVSVNDFFPGWQRPNVVEVEVDEINTLLGTEYNRELIVDTLENVGFAVEGRRGRLKIVAPYWRTDIHIKEDIIEEVGRLLGYDNIAPTLPLHATSGDNAMWDLKHHLREVLARCGANEVLTYSFVNERLLRKTGMDVANSYRIVNSISPDLQVIRQSLIPSLLEKTYVNEKLPVNEFAMFEMNQVYAKDAGLDSDGVPVGKNMLGFVVAERKGTDTAFYKAKKYLAKVLDEFVVSAEFLPVDADDIKHTPFEPKRTAKVCIGDICLGFVGEFKNSVKSELKLAPYLAGFEIDLDVLIGHVGRKNKIDYHDVHREDLTVETDKIYAETLSEVSAKYPDAIITPGPIFQAEGQTTRNMTFHIETRK